MDLSAYHQQFYEETREHIDMLTALLLAADTPTLAPEAFQERIGTLFRAMHTIKGSARMLGQGAIGTLAHECEHLLADVRSGVRPLDPPLVTSLLAAGESILTQAQALVGAARPLVAPATLPPSAAEPVPASSIPAPTRREATVRVKVDRLDRLMDLAGELVLGQQLLSGHPAAFSFAQTLIERQQRQLRELSNELRRLHFNPLQRANLERLLGDAQHLGLQLGEHVATCAGELTRDTAHLTATIHDVEHEVMSARLVPVQMLFAPLPRTVHTIAATLGRDVRLQMSGETSEIDRKLIEGLTDPLIHLLRNAIDHGIEPPEERLAAGKPAQGTIRIAASTDGSHVRLVIQDDGRGMRPDAIRARAIQQRLMSAERAAQLTDQEAIELVLLPGMSTAQIVTDLSGRGVGMDIVRTNITELDGYLQLASEPGTGTTVTLIMPMTLVTTKALLFRVQDHVFGAPIASCNDIRWIRPDDLHTIEGREVIPHHDTFVPVVQLAASLGIRPPMPLQGRIPAILVGSGTHSMYVLVDQLLDERELVIKPLGPLLEGTPFSGASHLNAQQLILILNPAMLGHWTPAPTMTDAQSQPASNSNHLLLADDSFTTRELVSGMLRAAGYAVTTACDGQDALDKLRQTSFDLIITDVEMPHLNGFELTSQVRHTPHCHRIPIIIMTSLASEAHRRQGLAAGAQAYIVKSQFNQSSLLEIIEQLLASARRTE